MDIYTRRTTLKLTAGALLSAPVTAASLRDNKPGIRIGLSQYSLRQLFASGELSVMDYPAFAREKFGITDIDVWEGGMPGGKQNQPEFLKELRQRAVDGGSHFFLWMTNPVDCTKATTPERASIVPLTTQQYWDADMCGSL